MPLENVCLEALAYTLPDEVVSSADIERRLAPLYERLRLPEGRLELISGIAERRFWPPGTLPSQVSERTARQALHSAGIERRRVGALVHASVCRDHLEPATACAVHHRLQLPAECLVYDVSNACLGLLNGLLQVATLIELDHIEAGLVVGTEGSRQLVETTIDALNRDTSLTRESIKPAIASLTIGSASAAVLLVHRRLSRTQNRLTHAVWRADTAHHALCHSGRDEAVAGGMRPLMQTDSEALLQEGIRAGAETYARFLAATGWQEGPDKTFCHQVGTAHRRRLLETLGLCAEADFSTVQWLGNTGSVALPVTLALGAERGHLSPGDRVGLLGIGSGINCLLLAVDWQQPLPGRGTLRGETSPVACAPSA